VLRRNFEDVFGGVRVVFDSEMAAAVRRWQLRALRRSRVLTERSEVE
jgi:hypothetical protein